MRFLPEALAALGARLWGKVELRGDGCWYWRASATPAGHGKLKWGDGFAYAYRLTWEALHGPLGARKLAHTCGERRCINPAHLVEARANGKVPSALRTRFWRQVARREPDECWIWTGVVNPVNGYGAITVTRGRSRGAHRVAWELERGPIPEGLYVCHHCDNPPCVNPGHLFLGTATDNMRDMRSKGRGAFGSRHVNSKIDEVMAAAIRDAYARGEGSYEALAQRFGTSAANVGLVVRRETWQHVSGAEHRPPVRMMTNDRAVELRALYAAGAAVRDLAAHFGVSLPTTHRVLRGAHPTSRGERNIMRPTGGVSHGGLTIEAARERLAVNA